MCHGSVIENDERYKFLQFFSTNFSFVFVVQMLKAGNAKGEVSLYRWPPVWLVWNQLYDDWQFLFLFAKQANPNRRSTVQWYFPLFYFLLKAKMEAETLFKTFLSSPIIKSQWFSRPRLQCLTNYPPTQACLIKPDNEKLGFNHRYLREVDCSRQSSLQKIYFNKIRVKVMGANMQADKAGGQGE
jgi:hypothetical protein